MFPTVSDRRAKHGPINFILQKFRLVIVVVALLKPELIKMVSETPYSLLNAPSDALPLSSPTIRCFRDGWLTR